MVTLLWDISSSFSHQLNMNLFSVLDRKKRSIALVVKTSDTPLNSGGGLCFFVSFCFRTSRK